MSVDDDTLSIRLLYDVREVFVEETIGSGALVRRLVALEDRPRRQMRISRAWFRSKSATIGTLT